MITGFADNLTPGDADPNNMTWANIQALVATGRWQVAFHAGQYGHGDSYADVPPATINLGGGVTLSFPSTCPYFYSCLGTRTTTTGSGRNRTTTTATETPAQAEARITSEVTAGMTEIKAKVPSASMVGWALPFNDAGQWTNLYNDPSGTLQSWLPGLHGLEVPAHLHPDQPGHLRTRIRDRRSTERVQPPLPLRSPHRHHDHAIRSGTYRSRLRALSHT